VDGQRFSLELPFDADSESSRALIVIDGKTSIRFPQGTRLVTDRHGVPKQIIGMVPRKVFGSLEWEGRRMDIEVEGNQIIELNEDLSIKDICLKASPVIFPQV
jgi:hypothetical protein